MLPPAVSGPAKVLVLKIGDYIREQEKKQGFKEYEGVNSAMLIVQEAMENALTEEERNQLADLPGGAPSQVVEAWFAQRALDKIRDLRESVGVKARRFGITPDPTKAAGEGNFIPAAAVQRSDIDNLIIREHLTPFDKEILKSRRYLVDVKRLTTSVDMPEFKNYIVEDPETGKKKRKRKAVPGKYTLESPTMSDRSQLAQGRVKMVANENLFHVMQTSQPVVTRYDSLPAQSGSLAAFSELPETAHRTPVPIKKSLRRGLPRFVVPLHRA
jgi:hypothetical protein